MPGWHLQHGAVGQQLVEVCLWESGRTLGLVFRIDDDPASAARCPKEVGPHRHTPSPVCYDDETDTLLTATQATAEAKTLALSRLRTTDARGSS